MEPIFPSQFARKGMGLRCKFISETEVSSGPSASQGQLSNANQIPTELWSYPWSLPQATLWVSHMGKRLIWLEMEHWRKGVTAFFLYSGDTANSLALYSGRVFKVHSPQLPPSYTTPCLRDDPHPVQGHSEVQPKLFSQWKIAKNQMPWAL